MDLTTSLSIIQKQLAEDSVFFPTATLTDLYNTAQKNIYLLIPSIIKTASITITALSWMYPLPADLIRIKDIYHSSGYFLTETLWEDMDLLISGQWEGVVGATAYDYWLWLRPRYLVIYPSILVAAGTLTVYYYAESTDLSGTQQTDIPDQYENALNYYTRALALISDKKFNQATPLLTAYFEQLNLLGGIEIKRNIGISEPDKVTSR